MVKKIRRNRFAEKLKAMRSDAGLNQVALAQILGVTQVTVSLYESGRREPDLDDLMAICDRMNTTPNDMLGFVSSTPVPTVQSGDNSPVAIVTGSNNKISQNINSLKSKKATK